MQLAELTISHQMLRRVSTESLCDERTLYRYITGAPIRRSSRERIERALHVLGIRHRQEAK